MQPVEFSQLLIGLPATGKTTFLAALWYVAQDGAAASSLALDHVLGDTRHLNEIRDHWLRCTRVPRTVTASESLLSLHLKEKENGRPVVIKVPDLAGELFEAQWRERHWPTKYDEMLLDAGGALLFIHPNKIQQPNRIDMIDALLEDEQDAETAPQASAVAATTVEWNADEAPTQVKLVELLQLIAARGISRQPFRVAVIISAWDTLLTLNETPAKWLAHQLPLLDQMLKARADVFPSTVYGLSAQGGEYADAETDPLSQISPLNRIQLAGDAVVQRHDITEPIRWLMR